MQLLLILLFDLLLSILKINFHIYTKIDIVRSKKKPPKNTINDQ